MTTTYTTIADLEGLADGSPVLVRRGVGGSSTAFVKRAKGLEREEAVVPFWLFQGALAGALVTDDERLPEVGRWYTRDIWMYYVTAVNATHVDYLVFRNGTVSRTRHRTLQEWGSLVAVREAARDDVVSALSRGNLLYNTEYLARPQTPAVQQVEVVEAMQREVNGLRERLAQISRLAG